MLMPLWNSSCCCVFFYLFNLKTVGCFCRHSITVIYTGPSVLFVITIPSVCWTKTANKVTSWYVGLGPTSISQLLLG
jgi:hypothetical protein